MERFLVGIKDSEDIDGVGWFIDGEGNEVRKSLHGLTADIPVTDGGGGGQISDAIKIIRCKKKICYLGGLESSLNLQITERQQKDGRLKKGMVVIIHSG